MQKKIFLCVCFLFPIVAFSQNDFLLLKKRHKTIDRFYSGSYISFRMKTTEWVDAYINKIQNDSLFIKPFELIHFVNAWGMPAVDTMWRRPRIVAVKSIDAFPQKDRGVSYIRNGNILKLGGAGYILLNVINTLSSGDALFDNNNGKRLAIAAAVFALGTLIHKSNSPELHLGRKYRLQYMKT